MKSAVFLALFVACFAAVGDSQTWNWLPADHLIQPSGVQVHERNRIAAGDVDGDGWPDLLVWDSEGMRFYQNRALPSGLQFTERPDWTPDADWSNYPPYTKPALADLDADGCAELIVPALPPAPQELRCWRFDPQNKQWRQADSLVAGLAGRHFVVFVDFDSDGDLDGFAGGDQGYRYFENTGAPQRPEWSPSPRPVAIPYSNFHPSHVQFAHINSDSLPDMIAVWDGDFGSAILAIGHAEAPAETLSFAFDSGLMVSDAWFHTSLALADFNRDGRPELLLAHEYSPVHGFVLQPQSSDAPLQPAFYLTFPTGYRETAVDVWGNPADQTPLFVQVHTARPTDVPSPDVFFRMFRLENGLLRFQEPPNMVYNVEDIANARPTLSVLDWDGDGRIELVLSGEELDGQGQTRATRLWMLQENAYGVYVMQPEFFQPLAVDSFYLDPVFFDANADGRLDMLLQQRGRYALYENTGSLAEPFWQKRVAWSQTFAAETFYRAAAGDLDRDGRAEIVFIRDSLNLVCYRNIGTAAEPRWQADAAVFQKLTLPAPVYNLALADLDTDGDADLILSDRQGRFTVFRNDRVADMRAVSSPRSATIIRQFRIESRAGEWRIQFALAAPQPVRIRVFDLMGRQVGEIGRRMLPAGTHTLRYRNPRLARGVYFIRIHAGRQSRVRKAVWMR